MVSGLNELPTFISLLPEEAFQLFDPGLTCIMNKALTGMVTLNRRRFFARHLWELMKGDFVIPENHRQAFLPHGRLPVGITQG